MNKTIIIYQQYKGDYYMNAIRNKFFKFLIIYYWFLTVFVDYNPARYNNSGIKYYLLMIPIAVFIIINLDRLIKKKIQTESLLLIIFLLTGITFSLIKIDIKSILDIAIWTLPIIIIFNSKYTINLKLLNRLFLLTIIAGIVYYHLGINEFGYLPGQTFRNLHQGLWWRVSIFPYRTPPATGMFSLIVLLANYYNNSDKKSKLFFIVITLYFLILSGSRTSLLILLVIIATFIIRKISIIKGSILLKLVTITPIVLLLTIFIFPDILLRLNFENEMLNSLVFRSTSSLQNIEELKVTLNRQNIWKDYFDLYKNSPIIGNHSNDVSMIDQSETIILKLLAQFGIAVFFLIVSFYRKAKKALIHNNDFTFSMISMLSIMMLVYSSFLLPYNIIYLLMFTLINDIGYCEKSYFHKRWMKND